MSMHLAEISLAIALGDHAVLLVDQAACQMPGTQPSREYLAVDARQLALQPRLHTPRQYHRSSLRGGEQGGVKLKRNTLGFRMIPVTGVDCTPVAETSGNKIVATAFTIRACAGRRRWR